MRILLLSGLFFLMLGSVDAQIPVAFPSEYIDFKIDSSYFSINGVYTFQNKTGKNVYFNIEFPFGVNTSLIDSIRVVNLKNLQPVHFKTNQQNISFYLNLLPHDTVQYNIFYRQQLAKVNTYILTTTKSWGLPLDNAVYSLTVHKNIKIKSISMEPDSSKYDLNNITYYWRKQNFTPQADFEVIIEK